MKKIFFYSGLVIVLFFIIIYYLYNIMNNKPVYAIAVFNDDIKGNVRFTEDLENNIIKIDLHPWRFKIAPLCQIKKVYPLQECVNFGYGISSKIPEVLG